MINLITDGIYNPFYSLPLFMVMELIEFIILWFYNNEVKEGFTLNEMIEITLLMNISSACMALPIWLMIGRGIINFS
jgi:hypothetical protein